MAAPHREFVIPCPHKGKQTTCEDCGQRSYCRDCVRADVDAFKCAACELVFCCEHAGGLCEQAGCTEVLADPAPLCGSCMPSTHIRCDLCGDVSCSSCVDRGVSEEEDYIPPVGCDHCDRMVCGACFNEGADGPTHCSWCESTSCVACQVKSQDLFRRCHVCLLPSEDSCIYCKNYDGRDYCSFCRLFTCIGCFSIDFECAACYPSPFLARMVAQVVRSGCGLPEDCVRIIREFIAPDEEPLWEISLRQSLS